YNATGPRGGQQKSRWPGRASSEAAARPEVAGESSGTPAREGEASSSPSASGTPVREGEASSSPSDDVAAPGGACWCPGGAPQSARPPG
ncbi:hypothetical protein NDU88_000086, partial [Pleurodeles waltl]